MPNPPFEPGDVRSLKPASRVGSVLRTLTLLLMLPVLMGWTRAPLGEYDIKLAYLFNLALLTYWQDADKANEFPICLLGANPFGARLNELDGRLIGKSLVHTRKLQTDDWSGCRILFIAASERQRLPRILQMLGAPSGRGILTVSDFPGFVGQGGMIEFFRDNTNIRFALDAESASRAGLKFNAQLRQLASTAPEGRKP